MLFNNKLFDYHIYMLIWFNLVLAELIAGDFI